MSSRSLPSAAWLLALATAACTSAPKPEAPFQLPPTIKAVRSYPRLANYFHRMDLPEALVAHREEYLAQWDVIILNPQAVGDQGLDLAKLRAVNPAVRILAWIPFGQSSLDFEMSTGMEPPIENYFLKDRTGAPLRWPWGGYFMNPYTGDPPGTSDPARLYAFPRHVVSYVEEHYLRDGTYDGVMFDCIWSGAPRWASSSNSADVNVDGVDDEKDDAAYLAGDEELLARMRAATGGIVTANAGDPWAEDAPYYAHLNGVMLENALGDEWRPRAGLWESQWGAYQRSLARSASQPATSLVAADVRYGRTQEQAERLTGLTAEDQRRFRLGLAMTLLGDGYFGFDRGDGLHGQLWWFREYDVDLGTPAPGYEAPGSWREGVYGPGTLSREFTRGTVVVNPTGAAVRVSFADERTDASTGAAGAAFDLPASDGRMYVER